MNKLISQKIKHKYNSFVISNSFTNNIIFQTYFKCFSIKNPRNIQGPYKENNLKGYINFVRKNAHKYANLDPLNINTFQKANTLLPHYWGLSEIEKIEDFPLDESATFTKEIAENLNTIQDLEQFLNKNYLSKVSVEFEHIDNEEEKFWLYENYENQMGKEITNLELQNAFKLLYPAMVINYFKINILKYKI